jgi:hypothetical protein
MKYILVLFYVGYKVGAGTSVEFNSLEACKAAEAYYLEENNWGSSKCWPKGEEK